MKTPFRTLFVFLVLLSLPRAVWANAGTPLMWAEGLHLLIGNALIGLLEGLLLAWLFRAHRVRAVASMIAGNYFSTWVGSMLLHSERFNSLPIDLTNGWQWFWLLVAAAYGITLVLELPFVALALLKTPRWLVHSLWGSLIVQSISYAALFGWYWMASGTSLFTDMHIVDAANIPLPESVLVYYIAPSDGCVYRSRLTAGDHVRICDVHSTRNNDRLIVRPCEQDRRRWDLIARLETDNYSQPRLVDVEANMEVVAAPQPGDVQKDATAEGTWFTFGPVPKLGVEADSLWSFWSGFWPLEGLTAENRQTGQRVHLCCETVFIAWTVRNAVQLSDNVVLFQLGHDQICAFDVEQRRVALLWHGRGPVAVLPQPASDSKHAVHQEHSLTSAEFSGR